MIDLYLNKIFTSSQFPNVHPGRDIYQAEDGVSEDQEHEEEEEGLPEDSTSLVLEDTSSSSSSTSSTGTIDMASRTNIRPVRVPRSGSRSSPCSTVEKHNIVTGGFRNYDPMPGSVDCAIMLFDKIITHANL
tara:strand:- start:914 stop:1309 length:396 start_codon:yes stop_codon:yes gene_type:complete